MGPAIASGTLDEALASDNKRAQYAQAVAIRFVLDRLLRLQYFRAPVEARVVQHQTKRIDSALPCAHVLVTLDARPQRLLRVIKMKRADVVEADMLFDLVDHARVTGLAANV